MSSLKSEPETNLVIPISRDRVPLVLPTPTRTRTRETEPFLAP
jgi:hypothetical protein